MLYRAGRFNPIALPPIKGKVEFENVSFRFYPHSVHVVKSVSFCVESGNQELLARAVVVSTIMKLLPRLYNLEEGVIKIDDYDIKR